MCTHLFIHSKLMTEHFIQQSCILGEQAFPQSSEEITPGIKRAPDYEFSYSDFVFLRAPNLQ